MTEKHICLMGDSIFDNDEYIPGEPGVIEQMRRSIPKTWSAFKVAVDGDCIEHIPNQLQKVPTHTTDIVVSIGGNDLMKFRHLLTKVAEGAKIEELIASPLADFEVAYGWMLDTISERDLRVSACTIYTAITKVFQTTGCHVAQSKWRRRRKKPPRKPAARKLQPCCFASKSLSEVCQTNLGTL